MRILLLILVLTNVAWVWDYGTVDGQVKPPPAITFECGPTATGPFQVVASFSPAPIVAELFPVIPSTAAYCRIRSIDSISNVAAAPAPVIDSRVLALDAKLAGICRAAKAMSSTSTSFAGRIRKEIPCP